MFKNLIKLRKRQVFYFLHRLKKKKIKYKYQNKYRNQNKCIQKPSTTNKHVNNNNINKYYNLLTTKPKTNKTVKMLKKLNINFIHDHIRDVIYKIRNCYHHYDDLFYTCNLRSNKRKRRKIRRTKAKTNQNVNFKSFFSSFSSSCSSSCSSLCCCENFKICSKFSDYIRHIWVYFQKTFKNLQFIIVIFLLALITTTANSVETREKLLQRKSTRLILASITAAETPASTALLISNTSESAYMPCVYIPNALNHNRAGNRLNFKQNICQNLKHFHHHRHRHNFQNLAKFRNNNKTWFKSYRKKLQNIKKQIHHLHHNRYYKLNHQRDKIQLSKSSYSNPTNITKVQTNLTDLGIKKIVIQHNTHNDILPVNMHTNEEDNINDNKISDHEEAEINKSHFFTVDLLPPVTTAITKTNDNQQTIVEKPLSSNHDHHHQMDNDQLTKLVMTGLGLQKRPNMKTVNISQQEYATKYREYLQLVHTRKRRELRDNLADFDNDDDAYSLKPLQILSIVSNNSIINNYYDGMQTKRQKREMVEMEGQNAEKSSDGDIEIEDMGKQLQNILFVTKKHKKPRSTKKQRGERKTNIRLMFALKPEALNLSSDDIEEANIRLVLIHSPTLAIRNHKNKKKHASHKNNSCRSSTVDGCAEGRSSSLSPPIHSQVNVLNLKLFFINKLGKRTWLDGRKVDIYIDLSKLDETHTQWLQFDVTKAVKATIEDGHIQHVALELQCENCKRVGARILNDAHNTASDAQTNDPTTEGYQLMPVLNIIGRFAQNQHSLRPHKHDSVVKPNSKEAPTTQRLYHHHQVYNNDKNHQRHNNRRPNCYKTNQRCCRHTMEVTFKEIKGFEFIIQPKVFDAGYCHGRCPPRYNPAHHHAMLQSLIWKQNHQKAPRPCCAPSKLAELEVLHVDEKDSEKLKISTWSDMKIVECACS